GFERSTPCQAASGRLRWAVHAEVRRRDPPGPIARGDRESERSTPCQAETAAGAWPPATPFALRVTEKVTQQVKRGTSHPATNRPTDPDKICPLWGGSTRKTRNSTLSHFALGAWPRSPTACSLARLPQACGAVVLPTDTRCQRPTTDNCRRITNR